MLRDLLDEKHISAYALAKDTDIPYSTIADIISGKTDIKNVSATLLYKIAHRLEMTMEQLYFYEQARKKLYLYNEDRRVFCQMDQRTLSYLGPKNLVGFCHLNAARENCLYIDTYFLDEDHRIYREEDYIDLNDLFQENHCIDLLEQPYEVYLGRPDESYQRYLMRNALMVSDNMAILIKDSSTEDIVLEVTNVKRNRDRMLMRLKDYAVLSTNMSDSMKKRALYAVERNADLILEEVKERA